MPYALHIVLTDNGIQFTNRTCDRYAVNHIFTYTCDENKIEIRLAEVKHAWTNEEVERMKQPIKSAIVKRFHYDDHEQFKSISPTSSTPIFPEGSRHSKASRPTN